MSDIWLSVLETSGRICAVFAALCFYSAIFGFNAHSKSKPDATDYSKLVRPGIHTVIGLGGKPLTVFTWQGTVGDSMYAVGMVPTLDEARIVMVGLRNQGEREP